MRRAYKPRCSRSNWCRYVFIAARSVFPFAGQGDCSTGSASFAELYGRKLEKYIPGGFAGHQDGRWFLTVRGLFVSNYILSDVLEFADLEEVGFNGTR